jgi:hypothetical protein
MSHDSRQVLGCWGNDITDVTAFWLLNLFLVVAMLGNALSAMLQPSALSTEYY